MSGCRLGLDNWDHTTYSERHVYVNKSIERKGVTATCI